MSGSGFDWNVLGAAILILGSLARVVLQVRDENGETVFTRIINKWRVERGYATLGLPAIKSQHGMQDIDVDKVVIDAKHDPDFLNLLNEYRSCCQEGLDPGPTFQRILDFIRKKGSTIRW